MKTIQLYIFSLFFSHTVFSQTVYDVTTNELYMPTVKVGSKVYTNVVITVGEILSLGGSYDDAGAIYNLKAAYDNEVKSSGTFNFQVTGSLSGSSATGNGTATSGGLVPTQFEGNSALSKTANISFEISVDGQTFPVFTSNTAFYDSNYRFLGSSGNQYEVVDSYLGFPTQASANDAGLVYKASLYRDSSKIIKEGIRTVTYSTTYESATSLIMTIILIDKDLFGETILTSSSRFRVLSDNSVVRISETAYDSSGLLTITFL